MHAALGNPNPNPRTLTPTLTCASALACAHPHLHLHPNPGLTPAVDVHFFVVPIEERERLTANCTTNIPGPQNSLGQFLQCSQLATDEATLKFFKLPPPEYTTGFAASPEFGDHAIIGHGILVCLETTPAAPIFACMAPPRKPRACMAPLTAASPSQWRAPWHCFIQPGKHLLDAKDMAPGGVAYATEGSNPGLAPVLAHSRQVCYSHV